MVNQEFYNLGTAPSVIRQLFAYGLEQAAKVGPEKVYDYSLGNPSIPAPKKVNESIKKIVDETDSIKLHGYSMAAGFDTARDAVAKDLSNRFGLDVKGSELFFTCGAAPALVSIIKALTVNSDSEIMVVAPFFPEYRPFITANGAKMVMVPADTEAFQIHLDEVEKRITANTQGIIINSPNNPSGVVYTEETLKGLAALLERKSAEYGHPIYIIADEPYRELVYGGVKVPFIPCLYKNTIVCYSYSKSLSLPGERIGYVYVPGFADDRDAVFAAMGQAFFTLGGKTCTGSLALLHCQFHCIFPPRFSGKSRKAVFCGVSSGGKKSKGDSIPILILSYFLIFAIDFCANCIKNWEKSLHMISKKNGFYEKTML